jgi:hypothetical protein
VHNANDVRCVNGGRNLPDDGRYFFRLEWPVLLCVSLEQLTGSPLDREKVHARGRLSDFECLDHVGVLDALTIPGFADEARDGSLVLTQFFPEYFDGDHTIRRMVSPENGGRPPFADFCAKGESSQSSSYEVFFRHIANVTSGSGAKQGGRGWFLDKQSGCSYIGAHALP